MPRCRAAGRSRRSGVPLDRPGAEACARAASLTSCTRPWSFTTSTPSIMPPRMASIRARSDARSVARRPISARRIVQHARHGADLVGAVVACRTRPVAAGIPFGDGGDRLDAPADEHRGRPRDGEGGEEADAKGQERNPAHRRELLGNVGQRERQAHEAECRHRRVGDGRGDVQHLGPDRRAVAARESRSRRGAPAGSQADRCGSRRWRAPRRRARNRQSRRRRARRA